MALFLLYSFGIFRIRHRFAPFIFAFFTGNLDCDMAEPAVFFRAVPVFDIGGNRDDASFMQADAQACLLPDTSPRRQYRSRADRRLPRHGGYASYCGIPGSNVTLAANRPAFGIGQRIQKGVSDKILSICGVGGACPKHVCLLECFFVFIFHSKNLHIVQSAIDRFSVGLYDILELHVYLTT